MIIEVVCYNLQSVLTASKHADRIELCSNPAAGGVSPSFALLELAKKNSHVPVFAMVRPREGDFIYDENELEIIHREIEMFKSAGADGIVCGILKDDGSVNTDAMTEIVNFASPLPVTFHRAFDLTPDPFEALEKIIESGCKRILTSGQKPSVSQGVSLVKDLIQRASGRIIIMPGAGITPENVNEITRVTRCNEIHLSAKKFLTRKNNANIEFRLGAAADLIQVTDEEALAQIRKSVNETG
jgi:copper homeostasis protein